jgi:hypothetical protein
MKSLLFTNAFGLLRKSLMLISFLAISLVSVQAQVSNTLSANPPGGGGGGGGGTDALTGVVSKQATLALLNTDLIDDGAEAAQLVRNTLDALKEDNQAAQNNPGTMTPAQFATNQVIIEYYTYLYNLLIAGGDLFTVLQNSFGYLSHLVSLQNPAHGINAMAIYQQTLDLLSAD